MSMFKIFGNFFMLLGVIFIIIGIFGFVKYKDFYIRATISSLIDTAGFITVAFGLLLYHKFSFFTFKIVIIILFMMLLNPLSTHTIVRSARLSEYGDKKGDDHA